MNNQRKIIHDAIDLKVRPFLGAAAIVGRAARPMRAERHTSARPRPAVVSVAGLTVHSQLAPCMRAECGACRLRCLTNTAQGLGSSNRNECALRV